MRDALRGGDFVGRVGRDEFLLLLPSPTALRAMKLSDKLRLFIKATTLPLSTEAVELSASLAVGAVGSDVLSRGEILASIYEALRKHLGKDRVSGSSAGRTEGNGRPRDAAEPESVELDAEAIALGFVLQGIQNVLTTLDLRAFRGILDLFHQSDWDGRYHATLFPSSVLSAAPDRITRLPEDSGTGGRVCIELSEQQFLGDPTHFLEPITELRACGLRIALDDAGLGRSSEAPTVLERVVVKVDRERIGAIGSPGGQERQFERLMAMLSAVDGDVIVDGLGTREQLGILQDMGAPYGQGFLWGEPTEPVAKGDYPQALGFRST